MELHVFSHSYMKRRSNISVSRKVWWILKDGVVPPLIMTQAKNGDIAQVMYCWKIEEYYGIILQWGLIYKKWRYCTVNVLLENRGTLWYNFTVGTYIQEMEILHTILGNV